MSVAGPRAWARYRRAVLGACLVVCAGAQAGPGDALADDPFRRMAPGYVLGFPADHAAHPSYRTEWWYYTGHLWIEEPGAAVEPDRASAPSDLGFQLTFFRSGIARPDPPRPSRWALRDIYFAHLAIGDFAARRFHVAERLERDALGLAGADSTRYHVWAGDWSAILEPEGGHRLVAAEGDAFGLELALVPEKPPVLHGEAGWSRKGDEPDQASYYYSLTRMAASGTVRLGGRTLGVRGEAWMDHEFTTGELASGLQGWDWFGLQLDDGTELMLYLLRRADGTPAPASSGSLVDRSGRVTHLDRDAFTVTSQSIWKSPRSGAEYPSGWRIEVPAASLALTLTPRLPDQELVTPGSTGITYWEGAVSISGSRDRSPITGRGFVELTGYAAAFRARM